MCIQEDGVLVSDLAKPQLSDKISKVQQVITEASSTLAFITRGMEIRNTDKEQQLYWWYE